MDEADMLGGCFDEPEEPEEKPKVDLLNEKDERVPKLRQKLLQGFRTFKESININRYIKSLQIFVKIATKAPYTLEMLQNVANPYHIKTLLQLLLHVSCQNKLKILSIFQTLLRIQVPISVFDESVKDLHAIRFRTQTKVEFKSSFAKFFFLASLQIQA